MFKQWLEMDEDAVRNDFGRLPLYRFKGSLFHGTGKEAMLCIAKNGFRTYKHAELRGNFFCVSTGQNVIKDCGGYGFRFTVLLDKILILNSFYYDLLNKTTHEYDAGFWSKENGFYDKTKTEKAEKLGLKVNSKFGIGNQRSFFQKFLYQYPRFKEVKGIYISHADEKEIALTQSGLDIIAKSVANIYLNGKWYQADEGWRILNKYKDKVNNDDCKNTRAINDIKKYRSYELI